MIIEHEEIKQYIPHRHPFLLVDRIIEIEPMQGAVGIKNVTGSEYFFPGHFPQAPIMPGVLIIEALAQVAGVLAMYSYPDDKGKILYLAGVDGARFKKPVIPGDTLRLEIVATSVKKRLWKLEGTARVGDVVTSKANITAMVAQ
ncbi:3-hydroxyacyl-[acyl-carrier-protein] dehydratase, FabZ form [hydrothermal vent metagenome]|uniref:3-hydroxyacyl-[acyl-carrier-protein] dehydratase n=1 Tax=hydrothermal vent metagenome TaxID=652676 RepID=A0A3B1CGC4_9ZZZZ